MQAASMQTLQGPSSCDVRVLLCLRVLRLQEVQEGPHIARNACDARGLKVSYYS